MIAGVGHQRVFIRGPNLQAYLCIPADGQTPPGLKVHPEPTCLWPRTGTSERKEIGREITKGAIKHKTQANKRFVCAPETRICSTLYHYGSLKTWNIGQHDYF